MTVEITRGPTVLLGDGLYFDLLAPSAVGMTVEDYAWGLASKNRFLGQTRLARHLSLAGQVDDLPPQRCLYNVAQHCCLMADKMLSDGCSAEQCFEGLMHESDEIVWHDFVSPSKRLLPQEVKDLIRRAGDAIDSWFGVNSNHKDLVKAYDMRMLVTEKRDLQPHAGSVEWEHVEGVEPFSFSVYPWSPEYAAERFIALFHQLQSAREVEASARQIRHG